MCDLYTYAKYHNAPRELGSRPWACFSVASRTRKEPMRPFVKLGLLLLVACCGSTRADDQDAWMLPKLPKATLPTDQDWYAPAAKRAGLEGTVLVAFDIASNGQSKNVSVLSADNSVFEASALQFLKGFRFKLPADWGAANLSRRWRLGFVYRLCPSAISGEFGIPVEIVYISGSRLAGAPSRTAPATKDGDTCKQAR